MEAKSVPSPTILQEIGLAIAAKALFAVSAENEIGNLLRCLSSTLLTEQNGIRVPVLGAFTANNSIHASR
jgi:hypothetical protein